MRNVRTTMLIFASLAYGMIGFSCPGIVWAETALETVLFEDRFEGKLADGWTWLRENPDAWRLRDGALEIRIEPGNANTVKNALVRTAPDRSQGKYAVEVTVTMVQLPPAGKDQVSIQGYHGPPDTERWVRFQNFRILRLDR